MVSKRVNASVSDWPLFVDGGGRGMQDRDLISGRLKLKEYKTGDILQAKQQQKCEKIRQMVALLNSFYFNI